MADPTIVHSNSGTSAVASTAAAFGFTAAAGNLLWLTVAADDYKTGDPIGWTLLSPGGAQETFLGHYVWWKKAAGTETTVTYVIGSATKSTWHVVEFDNIDPTTQLDVGNGTFLQSSAASMTTPTLTPSAGRRLIVATIGSTGGAVTGVDTWTNGLTEVLDTRTAAPVVELGTAWLVMDGTGSATISTTANYVADTPSARTALIASFNVASTATAIPYVARPQSAQLIRDLGESYWTQPRRVSNPALLGTALLEISPPVRQPQPTLRDAGETYWTQPVRRTVPAATAVPADPTLAGTLTARLAPATHADRREVPTQRAYPAPPDPVALIGTGALGAWWSDDNTVAYLAARLRQSDPSLLTPSGQPFDPLLAGTPAQLAARTPATHADRRQVGQQPVRRSVPDEITALVGTGAMNAWWSLDDAAHFGPAQRTRRLDLSYLVAATGPADPTQLGFLPGWLARNAPATHDDRRLYPAQRAALALPDDVLLIGTGAMVAWWGVDDSAFYAWATLPGPSDPNLLAQAPVNADPTLLGWLPNWMTHGEAATHGERRLVPQQRAYISDPSTYPAAPATDPLTLAYGAGGGYWHLYNRIGDLVERREYPAQRAYVSDPRLLGTALLENELLAAGGVGGDRWRRVSTPATHAPRWALRTWLQALEFMGVPSTAIPKAPLIVPGLRTAAVAEPGRRGSAGVAPATRTQPTIEGS